MRTRTAPPWLGLLGVIAFTTGQAQIPPFADTPVADSVTTAVQEFLTSYYDAFSDRDWSRFEKHFWPGATMTTVWQPQGESAPRVVVTSLREFIEQAPLGPGSKEIFEERMLAADLRVRGILASVYVRYGARFGDPGEVMEWEGVDLFSLLRYQGEWRIVSLSYASDE